MELAYCLIVYRSYDQVKAIVDNLKIGGDVYIHVNKKSNELFEKLKKYYSNSDNIYLVTNRVKVNWGGFSNVKAILNTFEEASALNYDYYIHMSESDFPIKSVALLKEKLKAENDSIFFDKMEYDEHHIFEQFTKYNLFVESSLFRRYYKVRYYNDKIGRFLVKLGFKKTIAKDYKFYKSFPYYSLNDEALKYLLQFYEKDKKLKKIFKFSMSSDEYYIPTVLMNSHHRDTVKESLHYMAFINEHDVGKEVSLAKTLCIGDFEFIKSLEDKFFARKFNTEIDNEICNKIINELL